MKDNSFFSGDTDTNACIVGAIAESLYGVPDYYINWAKGKIPKNFIKILDKAYEQKRQSFAYKNDCS